MGNVLSIRLRRRPSINGDDILINGMEIVARDVQLDENGNAIFDVTAYFSVDCRVQMIEESFKETLEEAQNWKSESRKIYDMAIYLSQKYGLKLEIGEIERY